MVFSTYESTICRALKFTFENDYLVVTLGKNIVQSVIQKRSPVKYHEG